jgi:hypothetical protein
MSDPNEKHMPITWLWVIAMTFVYFIVSVALLNPGALNALLNKEVAMMVDVFGEDETSLIIEDARSKKAYLLYDSGLHDSVQRMFLPKDFIETGEVQEKKVFNTAFFNKTDKFINNAFQSFDLAILRFYSFKPWLSLLTLLLGVCVYTGYYLREIKKQGFDYSSPFRRGLSKKFLIYLPVLILVIFLLPIPITPLYAPFIISIIGIASMTFISNTIKRL